MTQAFDHIMWKFRIPNDRTLKLLEDRELWFGKPSTFNDPFEMNFKFRDLFLESLSEFPTSEALKLAIKQQFERDYTALIQHVGVFSLSRTYRPCPMWAYYADNHQGLALGFHFDAHDERARENGRRVQNDMPPVELFGPIDVAYLDDHGRGGMIEQLIEQYLGLIQRPFNGQFTLLDVLIRAIGVKADGWRHEEEVRYYVNDEFEIVGGRNLPFWHRELKHVIFGLRCDPEYKNRVIEILARTGCDASLWSATENLRTLTIDATPWSNHSLDDAT